MLETITIPKSHTELIIEEMFANIEKKEEFDAQTIKKLKELAQIGDLKKHNEVAKVLKPESGKTL